MFCRQSCIMNEFNAVSGLNMYLCVVMYCFIVACDMCICVESPFFGEEGRIRKDYRKEGVNLSPFFRKCGNIVFVDMGNIDIHVKSIWLRNCSYRGKVG